MEYRFLNDELAALQLILLEPIVIQKIKKRQLYELCKNNYKKFDTGQNPNLYWL